MSRLIFVNLPVADLEAAERFFAGLGFTFDRRSPTRTPPAWWSASQAHVMLLTRDRFADFAPQPVADPRAATEVILCVSADSRQEVDAFADAALAPGGVAGR